RLEHDVVAELREWRSIPGAVECDERTSSVMLRELTAEVEREVIGRPVAGEDRDRASLLRTDPDGLSAIAPVLGRHHQLLLRVVEVAFGPPIVGAALEPHELLRRQIRPLLGLVECWPVLRELIPAVLGRIDADARRVDGDAARVADAGGGQCIPHDAIVDLREERAAVKRDAGAPATAGLDAVAETTRDVGPAVAVGVLESDEESTGGRRVVTVIPAAPGVDVHDAVR